MNIELSFTERMLFQRLMPEQDSFENLTCRREVLEIIKCSSQELKDNKFKQLPDNQMQWEDINKNIGVQFSDVQVDYIKEVLKDTSKKKELHCQLEGLYKNIVN